MRDRDTSPRRERRSDRGEGMPRSYREWDLKCKVYVGNLGGMASKTDLEHAFEKYGRLRNIWVARNPPGFAFVEFEDPRDAEDAVRALDGTRIGGMRVKVEMSSGRSRREEPSSSRRRGDDSSSRRRGDSSSRRRRLRSRSPRRSSSGSSSRRS